jgi:hypothetical protein
MERKPAVISAVALIVIAGAAASYLLLPSLGGTGTFVKGQYAGTPRTTSGEIDSEGLLRLLRASNSNTYNVVFGRSIHELGMLQGLLASAEEEGIDIWITILPPSELSQERRYNMSYSDYIGWARELARLSLEHESLAAWSIDNVLVDYDFFTPAYMERITAAAEEINPQLMFVPVVYYPNVVSPVFGEMSRFFDGVQFYYTNFPQGVSDESGVFVPQVNELKSRFGGLVVVGIYATPWSEEYPTTPAYVQQMIGLAKEHADGVMIYTLQKSGEKLEAITNGFA